LISYCKGMMDLMFVLSIPAGVCQVHTGVLQHSSGCGNNCIEWVFDGEVDGPFRTQGLKHFDCRKGLSIEHIQPLFHYFRAVILSLFEGASAVVTGIGALWRIKVYRDTAEPPLRTWCPS